MASISAWILSIAGICLVTVIVDLVMPDGKIGPFVKNVVSYAVVLVIILPLPKILKSDISFEGVFSDVQISIQEDYIYNLNQSKVDAIKQDIENAFEEKEIYGAVVSLSADIFDSDMQIMGVYVDLYNVVISDKLQNIDIQTEVVSVVQSVIDIAKEKIIIYE